MTETERALVVVGFTETGRRLLRHAGEHASGCDVELVLLSVMPTAEFQDRDRARLGIDFRGEAFTVGTAEAEGVHQATALVRELFADLDVSYEVEGRVGRKATLILDQAAAHECTEVFLAGHRNSRWNTSTFDRVMTEVVTGFDGPVTVMMGPELDEETA